MILIQTLVDVCWCLMVTSRTLFRKRKLWANTAEWPLAFDSAEYLVYLVHFVSLVCPASKSKRSKRSQDSTAPGICNSTMVGAFEAAARTSFSPWEAAKGRSWKWPYKDWGSSTTLKLLQIIYSHSWRIVSFLCLGKVQKIVLGESWNLPARCFQVQVLERIDQPLQWRPWWVVCGKWGTPKKTWLMG